MLKSNDFYKKDIPMATETNISINQDRLWDSLMTMAKIGPGIAGGNNRQTVTLEDGEARNLLQKWSEEAGMTMKVDERNELLNFSIDLGNYIKSDQNFDKVNIGMLGNIVSQ